LVHTNTHRYSRSLGNHKLNPAFNEVGDDDGVGRNHYPPLFEKRHCFFHLPRKRDDIGKVKKCEEKKQNIPPAPAVWKYFET